MFLRKCFSNLKCHKIPKRYSSSSKIKNKYPERYFSGIQPTGSIHIGNYFGSITQWVELQNENKDIILSVADLHSITLPHDPQQLPTNVLEITATLLGSGIDPEKLILFQQSAVPEHTQLCWCLGCVCTMPRLSHLAQYKEKSRDLKNVPLGLFIYPILQAADILAYKATHVPVGEDQIQQIELAQELSRMFNKKFGNTFPVPHPVMTDVQYARLRNLRNPEKKMSKSDPDPKSRICLTDKPDDIVRNIVKARTDSISAVTYNPSERPGVSNLISIHSFVTKKNIADICKDMEGVTTGEYKLIVSESVVEYLKPIQQNIADFMSSPEYLSDVLKKGNEKAKEIAANTWEEVQYKLGFKCQQENENKIKMNTS